MGSLPYLGGLDIVRDVRRLHATDVLFAWYDAYGKAELEGATMYRIATDLTVAFDRDQPGALAAATEAIARAGINIDACAEIDGRLHLVTSDAEAARTALDASGFAVTGEQQALVMDAVDRPGTAAAIFRRIADAGVNVRFAYVGARNRIVIGPDDIAKAARALAE